MKDIGKVEIDGFKLKYCIEGEGPNVLILGSSIYYPRSFSQNLRKFFRLHFIDYRGFAEPPISDTDDIFSFDELLDDIEQMRQKLSLKECIVIGHSAHALLALEYAKKYPQHVTHVVMIGISPNLGPEYTTMAERNWKESVWPERKAALAKRICDFPEEELVKLPAAERFVKWNIRRAPQTWFDFNFDSSFLWKEVSPNMSLLDFFYGVALRDLDITEGLEIFDLPVFLALGRFDFIIAPPSCWDSVRSKFKDLTVRIFERSGHSPQYEEAQLFDDELLSWVSSRSEKKIKKIVVTPYNSDWPKTFEIEASKIKETLGVNCIAIHHIGSTAVPGLSAKPVIDMIGVVKNAEKAIQPLECLGFKYKGEYNIPLRFYFNRSEGIETNLHVYEENHPEIELNLTFRDYLRKHPVARDEYANLKQSLLKEKSSYEKKNSIFTGYNLGKDAFIRKILRAANFNRIRVMKCMHDAEWDAARRLRQKYFFDPLSIADPYTWTFDRKEHAHLILYQGVEIIGYAHIQFWPEQRAALRIFVIDEHYRNHGLGSQFLHFCEQWLKKQGIKSLHDEVRPDAISFYRKNGYTEMSFEDPSGEPPSAHDTAMGKRL